MKKPSIVLLVFLVILTSFSSASQPQIVGDTSKGITIEGTITENAIGFGAVGDTSNGITITGTISTGSIGAVGDTSNGITITGIISSGTLTEIIYYATTDIEALANGATESISVSTGELIDFSMLINQTPETRESRYSGVVGDTDNGITITGTIETGNTGNVGDTSNGITIVGTIMTANESNIASDTSNGITIEGIITIDNQSQKPVGDTSNGISITGDIVTSELGAVGDTSNGITINGDITFEEAAPGSTPTNTVSDTSNGITIEGTISFSDTGIIIGDTDNGITIEGLITQGTAFNQTVGDTSNGITINGMLFSSTLGGEVPASEPTEEPPAPTSTRYAWSFGDGSPPYSSETEPNTTHSFDYAGEYLVAAFFDDSGEYYNDHILITVIGPPIVKECSIVTGQVFDISTGENAGVINVTYTQFSTDPTIESVVCGSTATLVSENCSGGTCIFTCGSYSNNGTEYVTVLNLDDAGETILCTEFATVNVTGTPIHNCTLTGGICRAPNCNIGETPGTETCVTAGDVCCFTDPITPTTGNLAKIKLETNKKTYLQGDPINLTITATKLDTSFISGEIITTIKPITGTPTTIQTQTITETTTLTPTTDTTTLNAENYEITTLLLTTPQDPKLIDNKDKKIITIITAPPTASPEIHPIIILIALVTLSLIHKQK